MYIKPLFNLHTLFSYTWVEFTITATKIFEHVVKKVVKNKLMSSYV